MVVAFSLLTFVPMTTEKIVEMFKYTRLYNKTNYTHKTLLKP
jgi:hypothetical protein